MQTETIADVRKELDELKRKVELQHRQLRRLAALRMAVKVADSGYIPDKVLEIADSFESWIVRDDNDTP